MAGGASGTAGKGGTTGGAGASGKGGSAGGGGTGGGGTGGSGTAGGSGAGGAAGASGMAGAGGTAGTAGNAGQAGAGGDAAQSGAGGQGGTGATGGSAGAGGDSAGSGGGELGGAAGQAGGGTGGSGGDPCTTNLVTNGGFELIDASQQGQMGQGILPLPWFPVSVTPDTYSNDGSFGLTPDLFDNFTGVTAYEGIRWVAAWGESMEWFGQPLAAPLQAGTTYTLKLQLHMAVRADLAHDTTYTISLAVEGAEATDYVDVGTLPVLTTPDVWEERTITFVAPADADLRKVLVFRSITGYGGVDAVTLVQSCPLRQLRADPRRRISRYRAGWCALSGRAIPGRTTNHAQLAISFRRRGIPRARCLHDRRLRQQ